MLAERAGQGRDYIRDHRWNVGDSASELIQRGREVVNRQRDHLREALDAGKQAYRDTVNRPPESGTTGTQGAPGM
jgi:hypothetical protein